MDINVVFGGLMLICLNGQQDCPLDRTPSSTARDVRVHDYPTNTAWVVRAHDFHDDALVCGRDPKEETTLQLWYTTNQFKRDQPKEAREKPKVKCYDELGDKKELTECDIPYSLPDICVSVDSVTAYAPGSRLGHMARLAEIDRRFIKLKQDDKHLFKLEYVPTRIQFPSGVVDAGDTWYNNDDTPWSRSDDRRDGTLPRALSDKLTVKYKEASVLRVTDCYDNYNPLLALSALRDDSKVSVLNYAKKVKADQVNNQYDDLKYLYWYYRLGMWDTWNRECPTDAAVLRCVRINNEDCAHRDKADSIHWPPLLGGSY
jgi:hypothetical protein